MKAVFILVSLFVAASAFCQDGDMDEETVQNLENIAEESEEIVDDAELEEHYNNLKHRINLNTADEAALKSLRLLNDLQITNLLLYRKVFGPLIHIYELQAIPSWDIITIKKLLPMVTIESGDSESLGQALRRGEHSILIRYGKAVESSAGVSENNYLGSSDKLSLRYRYRYKSQLSWGVSAEKDAGEPLFKYAQKSGFDFYGAHLFLRKIRGVECIAIGDFTANLGQGLIHWQSLAFKKSAAVINIKRQSPVLRPYASTGEFNFLRGVGLTVINKQLSLTVYLSSRKVSANLGNDPMTNKVTISSLVTSGNHRTVAEMQDRRAAGQITAGTVLRYTFPRWQLSLNTIYHRFSVPIQKQAEPYNLHALRGKSFINNSIDYSVTRGNLHYFGEVATDKHLAFAVIQGVMVALDRKVDAAFLFRHVDSRYQSVTGNAFTESSLPTNETGYYAALTVRPVHALSVDFYFDLFHFPRLKYRVNAGSAGSEYLFSVSFKPNKQLAFYSRFRSSEKAINLTASTDPIDPVVMTEKRNFRNHVTIQLSRQVKLQHRFELSRFSSEVNSEKEGVMFFTDLSYKPEFSQWSAHGRLQHFNIDSYDARIYAYESTMPFASSIPAFDGAGMRYLVNVNYSISIPGASKWKLQTSLGWVQTIYKDIEGVGMNLDTMKNRRRSEVSVQAMLRKG